MVKRNVIATKLTKTCTQTQKRAFDVAVILLVDEVDHGEERLFGCFLDNDCAGGAFFESETGAKESFSEEDAVRRQDQLVSSHRA